MNPLITHVLQWPLNDYIDLKTEILMHSLATYAQPMVRPNKLFLIIMVFFAKEKNKRFFHSFIPALVWGSIPVYNIFLCIFLRLTTWAYFFLRILQEIFYIVHTYSRRPKYELSVFSAFIYRSVGKTFGFQTVSEIWTLSFGFRTFGWSTSRQFGLIFWLV